MLKLKHSILAVTSLSFALSVSQASAHCQVPCGIYSDATVFTDLHTHQATIEKAMSEIKSLSENTSKNANQLNRWINNKEEHAQKIQDIVAQYFLAQRIKTTEADGDKNAYLQKLVQLHQITVLSMKCKQTIDIENAQKLKSAIEAFHKSYSGK